MAEIGFSTGILSKRGIPLNEGIEEFLSAGADAIELSFGTPHELDAFRLKDIEGAVRSFRYVSIHAPWKDLPYPYCASDDDEGILSGVFSKLRRLTENLPIRGIVVHPDGVDDFKSLDAAQLPLAIENMDKRKKYGTTLDYFKMLQERFRFGFVLDVQHAYEHDPSMQLAVGLAEIMGKRLQHMHVSGSTQGSNHSPLYSSDNREAISRFLKLDTCKGLPMILEGIPSPQGGLYHPLKEELEFVKSIRP